MMKIYLFLFSLFLSFNFFYSQDKNKPLRSFQLEHYLENNSDKNELISLFIKGNKQEIDKNLRFYNGKLKGTIKDWYFVSISTKNIKNFITQTNLNAINFRNYKGTPLNDTMRVNNRINAIHEGQSPLNTSYEGAGVIMGFIDTGLDWMHPDFLNPTDSSTRVLALWDQTKPVNSFTPSRYGYGQDWDSSEIMQGLSTNNDQYGHGTTVTGAGCGNAFANGLNKGVAPKADIIAVESNFNAPNWLGTVADAVEYIYHISDSLNKPCIINASLGTYLGSHDGLDPYALYIDSLINRKKGHLMVASAGNSGTWGKYHLHSSINSDTAFTWFSYNASSAFGPAAFFEIWADTADFNQLEFTIGLDKVTPQFENRGKGNYFNVNTNLGSVNYDTIRNSTNQQLATVQYWSELRDGQYLLQVYIPSPDSNQYNIRFETVGTGKYDCWTSSIFGMSDIYEYLGGIANFSEGHKYINPDGFKTIVSSFQCLPSVITVGNYYNDSGYVNLDSTWTSNGGIRGNIAETSSKGPTRDNRLKPEIAASGHGVNSALPLNLINYYLNHPTLDSTLAFGGMHRRNGGTSMASPIVAGVGALLLEKCNSITPLVFKNALMNSAYSDSFTGTLPNFSFGYGKLDGFQTLLNLSFSNVLAGNLSFCEGDSSLITITNSVDQYNWNGIENSSSLYVSSSSNNYLVTIDTLGCTSDTLHFQTIENPTPNTPYLTTNFDSIISNNTNNNEIDWYYNNIQIPNESDSSLYITQNGEYFIIVTNQDGCTTFSDTINYNSVGIKNNMINKLFTYPNPANEKVSITSTLPILKLTLLDINGKLMLSNEDLNQSYLEISTINFSNGVYYLKLFTSQNTNVQKIVVQH